MAAIRMIEALPEENLIFPDEAAAALLDTPFPDFCCLACPHLDTALQQIPGRDDPCLQCQQPNQGA